ncbi:MAG: Na+/H+ antiporter NhaC family protein [Blautia sp.]
MDKKLEFYGGEWVSISPLIIFIGLIFVTTFWWGSTSDGALWIPIFLGIVIPFFLAKNKKEYSGAVIEGMASKDTAFPIATWIFAGVFSRILRMSGFSAGLAGLAGSFGVGPVTFTVVSFLAATLFSSATGTGFGTIAACMGVLYPTGIELGVEPAFLAGAILGGAAFGDNLAPISDSTIASATAMEVDVPRCVRSRLKYSLTAAGITVAIMVIVGNVLDQSANIEELIAYDPKTLLMIIPVIITLFTAVKTGDLILATTVGSVLAGLTAVAFGLMDFIQIDVEDPARTALFSVVGKA